MSKNEIRLSFNYGELSYNEENKDRFLRDAKRVLKKAVELVDNAIAFADISTNRAGQAVSGEVMAYLVLPDMQNFLFVEISQKCVPGPRPDHVAVLLQYRRFDTPVDLDRIGRKKKVRFPRFSILGNNQWLWASDITAAAVAHFIETHARLHPEVVKARADLSSNSFNVEDIPTVSEAIVGGGKIGDTLMKIKHAFDEYNAENAADKAEPETEDDPVKPAIESASLEDESLQPLLKEPAIPLPDIAPSSNDDKAGNDLLSIMGC